MESSELADWTVEDILGHQALISSQMARFEVRTQQVTAAKAVFRALGEKRPLLMEAGTGTGKTFAYLVPALLYLRDNPDHRVVISSHTINLQEQIYLKDIPFLLNLMGSPVESVLLKELELTYHMFNTLAIIKPKIISTNALYFRILKINFIYFF